MEWFNYIDKFNEKEENVWKHDESVLIDLEAWKNKDELNYLWH